MPSRGLETGGDLSRTLYERHAEMCKVFSNPTRLMILNVLRETELTVAAIGEKLRIAPGTVSPHLLMMKRQRVLSSRKEGNQVFYRLVNPRMLKAFDLIRDVLYEQMNHEGILTKQLKRERTRNRRRLQKVPAAYR